MVEVWDDNDSSELDNLCTSNASTPVLDHVVYTGDCDCHDNSSVDALSPLGCRVPADLVDFDQDSP